MNKSTGTEQKKKRRGRLLTWALILVGIGAVAAYVIANRPEVVVDFTTERIEIGSLFQEVSATGTINPIEVVDVGTQVSGIIDEVFTDHNAKVKKGQVIARMDMRNLQATVRESRANITKAEVALTQAQLNFDRSVRLLAGGAVTHADLERDEVELENAKANLDLMRLQAYKASINLSYATIISDRGMVMLQNVDVGQTVAASFATPTLFRIANDLTKMNRGQRG
jgi:HlyD family secretion protein